MEAHAEMHFGERVSLKAVGKAVVGKRTHTAVSVQQNSAHLRGPLNTVHQCLSKDKCLHSSSDVAALRKLMSVKAALGLRST